MARDDALHQALSVVLVQPDKDHRINDQMKTKDKVDDVGRKSDIHRIDLVDDGVWDVYKDESDKNYLDDKVKLVPPRGRHGQAVPRLQLPPPLHDLQCMARRC